MYAYNSNIVNKSTQSIVDNMDDKFDDLNDKLLEIDTKLQSIEDLINVKLDVCYKKVNDVYSMQNKVNEITKMNNQSIIHQINQYDEEIDDYDPNNKQQNINSIETSMSPQGGFDKLNKQCFIKHNNKNQEGDMFYMSSINKNEFQSKNKTSLSETSTKPEQIKQKNTYINNDNYSSTTSLITNKTSSNKSSENVKSKKSTNSKNEFLNNGTKIKNNDENNTDEKSGETNEENIFTNLYANNKKINLRIVKDNISIDNDSNLEQFINSLPENIVENFFQKNNEPNDNNASVILEMNSNTVKPYKVETTSPKFANAMKILHESNIIKNSSFSKLNELKKINNSSENSNDSSTSSSNTSISDNNSDSNNNIDINDFGQTFQFPNIIDLVGNNVVFANFVPKSNKVVELN